MKTFKVKVHKLNITASDRWDLITTKNLNFFISQQILKCEHSVKSSQKDDYTEGSHYRVCLKIKKI